MTTLEKKPSALAGTAASGRGFQGGRGGGSREASLALAQGKWGQLLRQLQRADAAPTSQVVAACGEVQITLGRLVERWRELSGKELRALKREAARGEAADDCPGGRSEGALMKHLMHRDWLELRAVVPRVNRRAWRF
jgi:hypothetical protein